VTFKDDSTSFEFLKSNSGPVIGGIEFPELMTVLVGVIVGVEIAFERDEEGVKEVEIVKDADVVIVEGVSETVAASVGCAVAVADVNGDNCDVAERDVETETELVIVGVVVELGEFEAVTEAVRFGERELLADNAGVDEADELGDCEAVLDKLGVGVIDPLAQLGIGEVRFPYMFVVKPIL